MYDGAALGQLDGGVLRWHVVRSSSEASLGAMHRLDASPTRQQGRELLLFIHDDRIALGCPSGGMRQGGLHTSRRSSGLVADAHVPGGRHCGGTGRPRSLPLV